MVYSGQASYGKAKGKSNQQSKVTLFFLEKKEEVGRGRFEQKSTGEKLDSGRWESLPGESLGNPCLVDATYNVLFLLGPIMDHCFP